MKKRVLSMFVVAAMIISMTTVNTAYNPTYGGYADPLSEPESHFPYWYWDFPVVAYDVTFTGTFSSPEALGHGGLLFFPGVAPGMSIALSKVDKDGVTSLAGINGMVQSFHYFDDSGFGDSGFIVSHYGSNVWNWDDSANTIMTDANKPQSGVSGGDILSNGTNNFVNGTLATTPTGGLIAELNNTGAVFRGVGAGDFSNPEGFSSDNFGVSPGNLTPSGGNIQAGMGTLYAASDSPQYVGFIPYGALGSLQVRITVRINGTDSVLWKQLENAISNPYSDVAGVTLEIGAMFNVGVPRIGVPSTYDNTGTWINSASFTFSSEYEERGLNNLTSGFFDFNAAFTALEKEQISAAARDDGAVLRVTAYYNNTDYGFPAFRLRIGRINGDVTFSQPAYYTVGSWGPSSVVFDINADIINDSNFDWNLSYLSFDGFTGSTWDGWEPITYYFTSGLSFEVILPQEPSYVKGDLSGNNRIDAFDALIAMQIAIELIPVVSADDLLVGDMNYDGKICADDALIILRLVVEADEHADFGRYFMMSDGGSPSVMGGLFLVNVLAASDGDQAVRFDFSSVGAEFAYVNYGAEIIGYEYNGKVALIGFDKNEGDIIATLGFIVTAQNFSVSATGIETSAGISAVAAGSLPSGCSFCGLVPPCGCILILPAPGGIDGSFGIINLGANGSVFLKDGTELKLGVGITPQDLEDNLSILIKSIPIGNDGKTTTTDASEFLKAITDAID